MRPGELVPGDSECRRAGDDSVVPPAGDHPCRRQQQLQRLDDGEPSNERQPLWADSAARILRPCQADGHDSATFKDLTPDPTTGQILYDVDNDGDGNPDSVWLDLGYPARRDSSGRLYKPLFAFMVIGLERPDSAEHGGQPGSTGWRRSRRMIPVGSSSRRRQRRFSPGKGPRFTWATRSARSTRRMLCRTRSTDTARGWGSTAVAAFDPPHVGYLYNMGQSTQLAFNTQVDNAGIDVRLTQLRNLLAGTRAADKTFVTQW